MKYGPNTKYIEMMLDQARGMTHDQAIDLGRMYRVVDGTQKRHRLFAVAITLAEDSGRYEEWIAAYAAAINITLTARGWPPSWQSAWEAVLDTARVLSVKDLVAAEQFDILYYPWASVFGEPKEK